MNRQIFAMFLLMTLSIATYAEPSKSVMFLVNEPLSMWDFGLYKLENKLREVSLISKGKITKTKTFATPAYDSDANRIIILIVPPINMSDKSYESIKVETVSEAKLFCRDMVNSVRFDLGANDKNLSAVTGQNGYVCGYFKHADFKNVREPTNLCSELESIIEIKSFVDIKGGGVVRCNGQLVGEVVYFSE